MFRVMIEGFYESNDFPEGIIGAKAELEFCQNEEFGSWTEALKKVKILKIEKVKELKKEWM